MDAAGLGTTLGEPLLSGRTKESLGSAASPENRGCTSTQSHIAKGSSEKDVRWVLCASALPDRCSPESETPLTDKLWERTTVEAEWTPPPQVKVS